MAGMEATKMTRRSLKFNAIVTITKNQNETST